MWTSNIAPRGFARRSLTSRSIVVGGEAFYHYRIVLSNGSEYFDVMLRSNMKKGRKKLVEFVDKEPKEWKTSM